MAQFTHLHVHSHYSMLDGMSKIPDLVNKARRDGMYAMALTDHGNMFGIKDFLDTVAKVNKGRAEGEPEFKPIVGTEAYCARRSLHDKDKNLKELSPETGRDRIVDSSGYHLILWPRTCRATIRCASWLRLPTRRASIPVRVSTTRC